MGKPAAGQINPNFEMWSRVIGGIVEHSGFGSVTQSLFQAGDPDPNEADMMALAEALHEERQAMAATFAEMVALANARGLFAAVLALDASQPRRANTAFGRFLTSQNQRIFRGGLRFVIIGAGHSRRYAVQRLELPQTPS